MSTWLTELKEGDTAFLRSARRHTGGNRNVTVMKVGRKWLHVTGGAKFDRHQAIEKGCAREEHTFGAPDLLYASESAYLQHMSMMKLKHDVIDHLQREYITDDAVRNIADILNLKVTADDAN